MAEVSYRCDLCGEYFGTQREIQEHNEEAHVETVGKKE
jgi:hypothetical protein